MKILHYLDAIRLTDGGTVRAVIDLCTVMAQQGLDVRLLTRDDSDIPEAWSRDTPIAVHRVIGSKVWPRIASESIAEVDAAVRDADLVHLHVPWDPLCVALARRARSLGKPYVLTPHGMLDQWSLAQKPLKKRLFLATFGRRLLGDAARIHYTARAEAEQCMHWHAPSQAVVVPLVTDLASYRSLPGDQPAKNAWPFLFTGDPLLVFLSRLHYKKGIETLIEAAALLGRQGAAFRLAIAGNGDAAYVAKLKHLIKIRNLDQCVHVLGFAAGVEKISLLQAADVFVLPTSQENWGYVLVEAMASGTPVVTTKGVDIWPELENSGGAEICQSVPEELCRVISYLLENEQRRTSMGKRGREWVLEALKEPHVAAQYRRMYADVLGE